MELCLKFDIMLWVLSFRYQILLHWQCQGKPSTTFRRTAQVISSDLTAPHVHSAPHVTLGTYSIPNALERSRAGLKEWRALYGRMRGLLDPALRNQLFTEPFATRRAAERTEMILANHTLLNLAKVCSARWHARASFDGPGLTCSALMPQRMPCWLRCR